MDEILFGNELNCSWREGRTPLSLSWRQERRTSLDTGSYEKSRDLLSKAASLPGRKNMAWGDLGLHTTPWIEVEEKTGSSPAENLFSVSSSKSACSAFSLLWPEGSQLRYTQKRCLVGFHLLLEAAGWGLNLPCSFQLRYCPLILWFSIWPGFQWNLKKLCCPWLTALPE